MKFVDGQMVPGLKKSAENGVALRRLLKPDTFEVPMQNALCLANHLARDGRLVVDAFLQHCVGG